MRSKYNLRAGKMSGHLTLYDDTRRDMVILFSTRTPKEMADKIDSMDWPEEKKEEAKASFRAIGVHM